MQNKERHEQFKGLYAGGTAFPEGIKWKKKNNRKTTAVYNSWKIRMLVEALKNRLVLPLQKLLQPEELITKS